MFPNGMPFGVVWIAFDSGIAPPINLNTYEGNAEHCKIITEFDAPKYEYEITAPAQVGGIGATAWSTDNAPLYNTPLYNHDGHDNTLVYRINENVTTGSLSPLGGAVVPYMFAEVNEYKILVMLCSSNNQWYSRGNGTGAPWVPDAQWTGGGGYINYNWETSFGASCNVATLAKNSFDGEAISFPYTWYYSESYGGNDWGAPLDCFGYNDLSEPIEVYFNGAPDDGQGYQRGLTLRTYCKNRDQIYKLIAGGGLKFKTDKVYKPVIQDGWVTGYTDDMSTPSELDGWHGSTIHTVTPTPPTPPTPPGTDEDNNDPINTAGAPFSSGIAHYYITTAGSLVLQHISEALGAWDLQNTGKDLFKNLISCKLIKPPTAVPSTSGVFTIYGEKPQYNGDDITISEVTGNPDQAFGPYTISRKFNDFRDYAPYSKAEIFLPYCGWCGLPSHVIGRSITVKYFTDIIAATCKAIVFCHDTGGGISVVAEAAGVIGCDIPMAADNVGMKMAGATTGLLAIVSGGVQTGVGAFNMMTGNVGKGAMGVLSGLSKVASGYTQSAMSLNENNTEISGKNGDGCCIAGTTNIIIKITRPKKGAWTTAPYVPSGFAHSTGFLSNKEVTVGSVTGLLIADNVDTSGIGGATDTERAEIKRVLETGLIVNSAPTPPE